MSNSLRPHGLWHARLPCPSPLLVSYQQNMQLGQRDSLLKACYFLLVSKQEGVLKSACLGQMFIS